MHGNQRRDVALPRLKASGSNAFRITGKSQQTLSINKVKNPSPCKRFRRTSIQRLLAATEGKFHTMFQLSQDTLNFSDKSTELNCKNAIRGCSIHVHAEQNLEFLVVCNDYPVFKTITASVQRLQGRLNCAPSTTSAHDYITRRKIDGIIVDMGVPGALNLMDSVRKGASNRFSVVFACVSSSEEASGALQAGANFIVHKPFTEEKIYQTLNTASAMMYAEHRRYFRYELVVPVTLIMGAQQTKATMSNLSEGGMSLWSVTSYARGSTIQFKFELPFSGPVSGKGEISWTSAEGLLGVKFHMLYENSYRHLANWISRRENRPLPEHKQT
jgi:CheY-like chemotaxis protein